MSLHSSAREAYDKRMPHAMPVSCTFSRASSGDLLADRRYTYAEAAFEDGDFIAARDVFAQTLELAPAWPPALFGLGKSAFAMGDAAAAKAAFKACLTYDAADHLGSGVYLARLGDATPDAMSAAYIATLFDDYAPRFDAHLQGALGYRAPVALLEALIKLYGVEARFSNVLDLGCGTGLMAKALAGRYDAMIGVDLSPGMLRVARESGLYARLEAMEITTFLKGAPSPQALVIAADVFCYIADLEEIFTLARHWLAPDGVFAFSLQTHQGDGVVMGADHRFHHAPKLIDKLANKAGYHVLHTETASLRQDRGVPVAGALFILGLP